VETQVRHLAKPALEPAIELLPRAEAPAGQGVTLDVLDPTFNLALGARVVGLAGVRSEAIVAREVLKRGERGQAILGKPELRCLAPGNPSPGFGPD
jgi:hypothetical protein